MILGDGTKHVYFGLVSLILNSGMEIFFALYVNIMPIDFVICIESGHITVHKMFIELIFKFLLCVNTELFALLLVVCQYGLN